MPQWKNNDTASNSVLWGVVGFNKTGNSVNRDAFYDNITVNDYTNNGVAMNEVVGQFAVNTTEAGIASGPVVQIIITDNGTGYIANSTITFTAVQGGSAAAATGTANTFGKISTFNISNAGSAYQRNPTIAFAAPANTAFNGNTAITGGPSTGLTTDANSTITAAILTVPTANAAFKVGDRVKYRVDAGNTAVGGLTTETIYFIQHANTTKIALAATSGGDRITLTKSAGMDPQAGHFLQGITATGAAVVGGAKNMGVAHAGWNVRTVGTGGRAGRVQYETLVAMGSIAGDGSDDDVLPDS